MRTVAQVCFVLGALPAVLFGVLPLGLMLVLPIVGGLWVPVLYYVIFVRHRDLDLEPLLLELQMLRNAVSDAATSSGSSLPLHQ